MAPHPTSNFGTVRTVIYQPATNKRTGGQDATITSMGEYVAGREHLKVGPRVPPTAATPKDTPVRPVYDDFATAHSSITSRSANGRLRNVPHETPKKETDLLDRGRPLPRRTLNSLRQLKKESKNQTLAQPLRAKVPNHRPISEFDFDISDACFTPGQKQEFKTSVDNHLNEASQKRTSVSPFLDSIKKAMGSKLSPGTKPFQSRISLSLKWPRDSMELSGLMKKIAQPTGEESRQAQDQTTPSQQPDEARLTDLTFHMEDPFVLESDHDSMSIHPAETDQNEVGSDSQQNQEGSSYQSKRNIGVLSGNFPGLLVDQAQETPAHFHGGTALTARSKGTMSTQEGSTVDGIVQQYARNNGLWETSLDSNDEDSEEDDDDSEPFETQTRVQNGVLGHEISDFEGDMARRDRSEGHIEERPFRGFKFMESSGSAPSIVLPQVPSQVNQSTPNSTSEGLGQSSSYGDTRNLLDITQRSQRIPGIDPPHFRVDTTFHPSRPTPKNANPFRCGPNKDLFLPSIAAADSSPNSRISQKMASDGSGGLEELPSRPLFALERDISLALRRVSALSNSSQETPAQCQDNGGFQTSTDSSGLLSYIGEQHQRAPEPPKIAARGFYDDSAIHHNWLDSERIQQVRIPIHHDVSPSSSPPLPYSASPTRDEFDLQELDGLGGKSTEWETVVDGVASRMKTAGSSLANNSSAGNISPVLYQHSNFSSTDRIVQHPAQIEYSHDYRYREIREGNFPVLLPSYKSYTVNGFPANSIRSISPFQQPFVDIYEPPPPLSRSHTNPFSSPPPEVITNKSRSSEGAAQDESVAGQPAKSELGISRQGANFSRLDHWMDDFGDSGPAVRPVALNPIIGATNDSKISLSESYSGSQVVDSSDTNGSYSSLSKITNEFKSSQKVRKPGDSKLRNVGGHLNNIPPLARERAPLIKGPPGAFYQGVRSRPDSRRNDLFVGRDVAPRVLRNKAAQKYPTNKMRPLSLLQAQYTEPAAFGEESRLRETTNDNYSYRSPLAPIKSGSWRNLYTKAQLSSMRDREKVDRADGFEHISGQSSRLALGEALKRDGSWKRTWSPHLRPWPRDNSSIKTDLSGRKVKLSSLMFGLCCLFPPMLVLYGVGYLDIVMIWITDGEISSFSKAHKKAALQLVCFFIVAILITAPTVVAVKVTGSK